jgi:hypothetical protein
MKKNFILDIKHLYQAEYFIALQRQVLFQMPGIQISGNIPPNNPALPPILNQNAWSRWYGNEVLDLAGTVALHVQPFGTHRYPKSVTQVLLPHGIESGKYDSDGSYGFGKGRTLAASSKSPLYQRYFAPSRFIKNLAENEVPELKGKITVVGDLRADTLLRRASLSPSRWMKKPTVLVISTYGVGALGTECRDELISLFSSSSNEIQYLFVLHPFLRRSDPSLYGIAKRSLARATIDQLGEGDHLIFEDLDWENYLPHCAAAISDHGSISLYYALLKKTLIYVGIQKAQILPDFPLWQISQTCPRTDRLLEATEIALEILKSGQDVRPDAEIAGSLVDFIGHSAPMHLQELQNA